MRKRSAETAATEAKQPSGAKRSVIKRLFLPLFGLRTKLTLSYALVTVAALLVVEIVVVVGMFAVVDSGLMSRLMARGLAEVAVPSVEPYLARTHPDLKGLQEEMGMISGDTNTRDSGSVPKWAYGPGGFTPVGTTLFVLDSERRLLGGYPAV